jgi:NAD(P)-dependent dehydrogenase (short-subunit alcohol dehydrogenase family)
MAPVVLIINLLGAVALTTALFDQVHIADGRFVYIGSWLGRLAARDPLHNTRPPSNCS